MNPVESLERPRITPQPSPDENDNFAGSSAATESQIDNGLKVKASLSLVELQPELSLDSEVSKEQQQTGLEIQDDSPTPPMTVVQNPSQRSLPLVFRNYTMQRFSETSADEELRKRYSFQVPEPKHQERATSQSGGTFGCFGFCRPSKPKKVHSSNDQES